MSQVTFGEDILAVLMAVGLISIFVVVLGSSFSGYQERCMSEGELRSLLRTSDYLRNGAFSKSEGKSELGLLSQEGIKEKIRQLELRSQEAGEIGVEITSLDHNILWEWGGERKDSTRSMIFPIAYEHKGKRIPARMIVWRGV